MPEGAGFSPNPDLTCEACLGRHRQHTREPGCRYFVVSDTPNDPNQPKEQYKTQDDPMADVKNLLLEIRREQRQQREDISRLQQARARSVSRPPDEEPCHAGRVANVPEGPAMHARPQMHAYVPPPPPAHTHTQHAPFSTTPFST